MGYSKQRFKNPEERKEFNSTVSINQILEKEQEALKSAWGLMESFTKMEDGFARIIIIAFGKGESTNWKQLTAELGKIFPLNHKIRIVKRMIKDGYLQYDDEELVSLPRGFLKPELPFLDACELAFRYRNILAHFGYIRYCQKRNGEFYMHPLLIPDDTTLPSVDISESSTITSDGKPISTSFSDFVFRLASQLPPSLSGPKIVSTTKEIKIETFLRSRGESLAESQNKIRDSKLKRLENFITEITTDT